MKKQTHMLGLEHADPSALERLPADYIRRTLVTPVAYEDGKLHVIIPPATPLEELDAVRLKTQAAVTFSHASEAELRRYHQAYLSDDENLLALSQAAEHDVAASSDTETASDDVTAQDTAIVKLVSRIIEEAVVRDASDIHIEPQANRTTIRYRVDGLLSIAQTVPANVHRALVARVKILASLDIAQRRAPQDGRITGRTRNAMDIRVSTVPTVHGEKVVMRLLKGADAIPPLERLGFLPDNLARFEDAIAQPYGLILVTGPTGSGKSFTLFSALQRVNRETVNVATVEDPVEYRLPGLNQVQVNAKAGVTFPTALRTFLRQDPDVIMVGEVRDFETAQIATEAALTGHLVMATLHTNDAAGAITRLAQMGVERFNVAAALTAVVAQRLVRRLCDACSEPSDPNAAALTALGLKAKDAPKDATPRHGQGCDRCDGSGYRGRTAVHELIRINPDLRHAIVEGAGGSEIQSIARQHGTRNLRQDAVAKAWQGVTSFEEVLRVTSE
jgi:type IV pilus assembly protein PilB